MNKNKIEKYGRTFYLLGTDKNGDNYYLVSGSLINNRWDFGEVVSFDTNEQSFEYGEIKTTKQIVSLVKNKDLYDSFNEFFEATTLSDQEIWRLCELIDSYRIAEKYSKFVSNGGSFWSKNPVKDTIINYKEYGRLTGEVIPEILQAINNLLDPEYKEV